MPETCIATMNDRAPRDTTCRLPMGHEGCHNDGRWLWWCGNGETCPNDCRTCAMRRKYAAAKETPDA